MVAATLSIGSVLNALKPHDLWGFLMYVVIILDVVTMFLQGQKGSLQLTIFLAISIMAALVNELSANQLGDPTITPNKDMFNDMLFSGRFANWMIGIAMFVFPLVVAGMTKSPKSRLPALLGAIFAAIFVFGRWFIIPGKT